MLYRSFTLHNFRQIPQMKYLSEEQKFEIEVVGTVLPFKTNNYVTEKLIDWSNFRDDPFFILTFPQKELLSEEHFNKIAGLLKSGESAEIVRREVNKIRIELNPNPAGQRRNVPKFRGRELTGIQHKYRETVLFFPLAGQTCHAYCTFCFRWPQFSLSDYKFAMRDSELLIEYLKANPKVTDVLFTGGDPAIMKTRVIKKYFNELVNANIPNLRNIRIGTKALSYWPYRFTTDDDADDLLRLFESTVKKGISIALMAHINHPGELKTKEARKAIQRLRNAGVQIRSQSPLLRNINDDAGIWAENWKEQVKLGIIPYYMFIARDTGAQNYFAVSLNRAWQIFRNAYSQVSGICRTVKGPSMSCYPGKVLVSGVTQINNEKIFVLNFLQGRNPDWVGKPFFAKFDPDAIWIDDLEPAFGKPEFFYEDNLRQQLA